MVLTRSTWISSSSVTSMQESRPSEDSSCSSPEWLVLSLETQFYRVELKPEIRQSVENKINCAGWQAHAGEVREGSQGEGKRNLVSLLIIIFQRWLPTLIPFPSGTSHGLWIRMRRSERRARPSSVEEHTSRREHLLIIHETWNHQRLISERIGENEPSYHFITFFRLRCALFIDRSIRKGSLSVVSGRAQLLLMFVVVFSRDWQFRERSTENVWWSILGLFIVPLFLRFVPIFWRLRFELFRIGDRSWVVLQPHRDSYSI